MEKNEQKKSSIFDKFKSVFRSKAPSYKYYNAGEVKVIAMKCRIYLQQYYKKCLQSINACNSILFKRKDYATDCYQILQEIGRHVIEVQSIKIYVQILKKIQNGSASIVRTNGDIALLKTQINWFQCILWYRKCKKIQGLDGMHEFCYNFFKGVDVTCQINPKCQIFKLYPIMLYLDPNCVVPLKKIYSEILQYINTRIQENTLAQIFRINKQQVRKWFNKQQNQYKQRYISNSKSPSKQIFRSKNISPKKMSESAYMDKSQKMQTQNHIKPINVENKEEKYQKQPQVKVNPQSSTSFMRRVMETSSKMKDNQNLDTKTNIFCIQCGKSYVKQQREKGQYNQGQSDPYQGQNLCNQCYLSKQQLRKQLQISSKIKQNKKIDRRVCSDCGANFVYQQSRFKQKISTETLCQNCQKNRLLINQSQQNKKVDSYICNQCKIQVSLVQQKYQSNEQSKNIIEQRSKIKQQGLCLNCYKNEYYIKCEECGTQFSKIQKQQREPNEEKYEGESNPYSNLCFDCISAKQQLRIKKKKDHEKICRHCNKAYIDDNQGELCTDCLNNLNKASADQQFEDEQQSMRFIRQSIVQKKKGIKKPYMVSIYARAQYVNPNK